MADYRENVVSSVLCFTKEDGNSSVDSLDILAVVDHHQLFGIQKASGLQETVGHIHSCLNTAANRHDGLVLLEKLVSQCSTDVFTNNVSTWFNLLIQVLQENAYKSPKEDVYSIDLKPLQSHDDIPEKQLSCNILGQLISTSCNFPELTREVSSSVIPKLIPSLLTATSAWQESATQCVTSCVNNFPGPCRSFRSKIEASVVRELDTPSPRPASIECFAVLAHLGVGPSQGGKQTDGWTERCQSLLSSLHHTLGCLYEGVEIDHKATPDNGIFTTLPVTEPARSSVLTGRYKTLTACLQALLSGKYSSSVKIAGQDIVRLVCRCLAVNYRMLLARPTTDRVRLFSRLPELHCSSLDLLTSLITCCKTELLPLSDLINKLYIQTLIYTHMDSVYGQDRPLSIVRTATYTSMRQWLQVLGVSSNLVTEEKDLVKEILHDITPVTDTLKLGGSLKSGLDPPPAKKKKKGGYQELNDGISSYRKINHTANSNVTVNALHVLHLFISSFGDTLKTKSYQDILDSVISTVIEVQQNVLEAPTPYQNTECRQALYRVQLACSLQTHPKVASPIQVNVGLFRVGLQDPNVEVAYSCQEALTVCECLVHPRAPCLRGPHLTQTTITVHSTVMEADQNANKIIVSENLPVSVSTVSANSNSNSHIPGSIDTNSHSEHRTKLTPVSSDNFIERNSSTDVLPKSGSKEGNSSDVQAPKTILTSDDQTKQILSDTSKLSEKEAVDAKVDSSNESDSSDVEMDEDDMVNKAVSEEQDSSMSCSQSSAQQAPVEFLNRTQQGLDEQMTVKSVNSDQTGNTIGPEDAVSSDCGKVTESRSVLPSTSQESNKAEENGQRPENKSSDVDAMLLSFVDAGPDSD